METTAFFLEINDRTSTSHRKTQESMNTQWKKIWIKATFWLVIEIILNLLGLDNLADYSEFIFEKKIAIATNQPQITVVVPSYRPQLNHRLPVRDTIFFNA